jgi:hypothetical protein
MLAAQHETQMRLSTGRLNVLHGPEAWVCACPRLFRTCVGKSSIRGIHLGTDALQIGDHEPVISGTNAATVWTVTLEPSPPRQVSTRQGHDLE